MKKQTCNLAKFALLALILIALALSSGSLFSQGHPLPGQATGLSMSTLTGALTSRKELKDKDQNFNKE